MCFSPEASFAAGALLAGTGIVSMKLALHPSRLLFAAIPILFATQQLSEGFLWLVLEKGYHG